MPSEFVLWSALRSAGRQYRSCQHPSNARKKLRALLRMASDQHWTLQQIAEASTLSNTTVRKYITK